MADRRVTARLNMGNAVKKVCDDNVDIVALVPAFVLLVTGLGTRITELRLQIKKVSKKNGGSSNTKEYWKNQSAFLLSIVCGAGIAYAQKIKDMKLEENFNFSKTALEELRDTELIETGQSIIDTQATLAAQLIDYGITTAFMTTVTEALSNFEEANPEPIANVSTTKAKHEQLLDDAFALSAYVLENMMKAALIYKVLNPLFYQSLDNASLVRDTGVRHDLTPEEKAARKEQRRLKKEAKMKEAAAKLKEAAERKEVQESSNATELLDNHVQEMNATTENIETPALPEPSLNGH